jgi:hypothetical protein
LAFSVSVWIYVFERREREAVEMRREGNEGGK